MPTSPKPLSKRIIEGEPKITRRSLFGAVGWSSLLVALGIGGAATARFAFPNDLLEPNTIFKIGRPDAFPEGVTFVDERRLFVVKKGKSIHVISAICTHLGCTVKKVETGFNCPCHGSKFDPQGRVISGPAPRPLEWFEVKLAPDGQLVVDSLTKVKPGFSITV